jgi:hypothetical protein
VVLKEGKHLSEAEVAAAKRGGELRRDCLYDYSPPCADTPIQIVPRSLRERPPIH